MNPNPQPLFQGIPSEPATLIAEYQDARQTTERLCEPLAVEDYVVQAMPDVSPAKWHLAHVSWFFETFLLKRHLPGYRPLDPKYEYLFNSYYGSVGPQYLRTHRGHLARPTVAEVYEYRSHVDRAISELVEITEPERLPGIGSLIALGVNHEQQHQELLLTDIKYNMAVNPLRPAYYERRPPQLDSAPLQWVEFEPGLHMVGHDGSGFAFDNEWPRHRTYNGPYRLASRLTTNGEYLEFIDSGGYERRDLWLSDGWKVVQDQGWSAPLYWEKVDGRWWTQTLSGMLPVDDHAPLVHVSYYEADAYARWTHKRLPTEHEWEQAAEGQPMDGNLLESGVYHPLSANGDNGDLKQLIGDVWEWTQSPYVAYPGFRPFEGDIGEYNGKFMVNQMVLRGGSCATPQSHIRATYRNFCPPDARWQFSGIRLAEDA